MAYNVRAWRRPSNYFVLPADRVPRSACEAGAALQIYFYLTARPIPHVLDRLSSSCMLAAVLHYLNVVFRCWYWEGWLEQSYWL